MCCLEEQRQCHKDEFPQQPGTFSLFKEWFDLTREKAT
jgi:hypothetical protein